MSNLKDRKRGGFYWNGNTPYTSVTNILKVIDKPAIAYWFGREVYRAMVLDPTLGEREALAMPYATSGKAKDRGKAVHSIVEAWKHTGKVVGDEGIYKGYAEAFQLWLNDHEVTLMAYEKTVFSDKYKYAGTLDLIVSIAGRPLVIDIKTGSDLYPEVHLQLSAYRQALEESGMEVEGTGALLLNEDGTYKYEIGKDKLAGFLACQTLWDALNDDLLTKMRSRAEMEIEYE